MNQTVAGGGIMVTGTYCVLKVDGVLEWLCWALLIAIIYWLIKSFLGLFKVEKASKSNVETQKGVNEGQSNPSEQKSRNEAPRHSERDSELS